MIIAKFDQTKANADLNQTFEGEAVRLSNELRSKPAKTVIDLLGNRIDTPAKRGFDIESADFTTIINWLADTRIKKSPSLIAFVHRVLSVRFPDEYTRNKKNIDRRYKIEMELIESKSKNDSSWFGEVGYQNGVRLDGSLTNSRALTKRFRNSKVVTVGRS